MLEAGPQVEERRDGEEDEAADHLSTRYGMDMRPATKRYGAIGAPEDVAETIRRFYDAEGGVRMSGQSLFDDPWLAAGSKIRQAAVLRGSYIQPWATNGGGANSSQAANDVFLQELTGDDPVLEWVTATGLRPVLNSLDDATRAEYVERYRQRLREAYPMRNDGVTLYPFRRLFMVALRAGG